MSAIEHGIWCPWAAILCWACHEKVEHRSKRGGIKHSTVDTEAEDFADRFTVTTCEKCSAPIAVDCDVGALRNLQIKIADFVDAELEQSGGMTCTLVIQAPNDRQILITAHEGPLLACEYKHLEGGEEFELDLDTWDVIAETEDMDQCVAALRAHVEKWQ